MSDLAQDAALDQAAAHIRDAFDHLEVSFADQDHRRALYGAWMLFSVDPDNCHVTLKALGRALGLC